MKNQRIIRSLLLLFFVLFLSACSSFGSNSKESISTQIQSVKFTSPSTEQRVIIYNHGVNQPQEREICAASYNQPPPSLMALIDNKTLIYRLCSTATEALAISAAGKQVYLRKKEIEYAVDAFLKRGVQPKNLFLAGHSNGAWTSLMMMRDVNTRFNGLIAYAPAFAGKRSETNLFPWWRNTVRPKQITDMLAANAIDALVFAYENDPYNRPQELRFLARHYPPKYGKQGATGVYFITYDCGLRNPHQTYRNDCQLNNTTQRIRQFIEEQIATWPARI